MFTVSHDHQMLQCPSRQQLMMERSWKPHVETAPNCPRCASSNTKFCYYNNYSFSQPRYFCKGCRRYWTKGGSLRNVPVGGGCRKSRRSKSVRPPSITTRYSPLDLTSSSSNEVSNAPRDSTIGSGIDLAVVFAKFLNQNSSSDHTELTGLELPDSGHVSVKVPTDHAGMETQKPSDLVTDSQLQEVVSVMYVDDHKLQQQQEERIQEFTGPDNDDPNNVFGLQALLSDDQVVEDALWSEATALPSFTWQPMVQFQEFDQTLSCDGYDQMKSSMNPMSDCWGSSFDLPSYELFSRP